MNIFRNRFGMLALSIGLFAACNSAEDVKNPDSDPDAGWKMGVALYSFNNIPYSQAMEKVDSGNIRYVEGFSFYKLGDAYGEKTLGDLSKEEIAGMKKNMEQKNVQMPSMYVGGGPDVEEWKKTFEMAREFGLEFVTAEPPSDKLKMIDSLAGIYKVKVAIHNHWQEISPAYWHPDSVLAIVNQYQNFGVCADIGHWTRSGLNAEDGLKKLEGHILGMHLKDVDEAGNAKANDVTVGTGVIDFARVVSELKRQKYKGLIYVECEHNFGNNLQDIMQSITVIDSLAHE